MHITLREFINQATDNCLKDGGLDSSPRLEYELQLFYYGMDAAIFEIPILNIHIDSTAKKIYVEVEE